MPSPYAPIHPVQEITNKPNRDLQRADLLKVIEARGIRRITFHYTGLDGKLKELKFPVLSRQQADRVLARGERVDGSSLFSGMVGAGQSDLYVIPQYRSAFINPLDEESLNLVCRFVTPGGELAPFAPDNILRRALSLLENEEGLRLTGLGELEFFLLGHPEHALYPAPKQRAYHATGPFVKHGEVLDEMIDAINRATSSVKYGHAEVGFIETLRSESVEIDGCQAEQMEIELLPQPLDDLADNLVIARWLIRRIAYEHGLVATFAPKLQESAAGNGMHVHLELLRGNKGVMRDAGGGLSTEARKLIAGLCANAAGLTAFGNTVSSSYLRLVPDHEAPTRVCWSDMNRSSMIRVPLGWPEGMEHARMINGSQESESDLPASQTVELRTPDGSAQLPLLLAGMAMAVRSGFRDPGSLQLAQDLYVTGDIHADRELLKRLPRLPENCAASAAELERQRAVYEDEGIFPPAVIEWCLESLRSQNDDGLHPWLAGLDSDERLEEVRRLLHKDLHRN